jgi:hypothetical protein
MKGTAAFDGVYCDRETELAIHVLFDDGTHKWIPKSVVDDDSEVYGIGHEGELVVAEWFALKEGLI